jgi:Uncharacterised protein family UPF0547
MTAETKFCPECAEPIKSAARVCRFCGYRFPDARAPEPSAYPEPSPPSLEEPSLAPPSPTIADPTASTAVPRSAVFDEPPPRRSRVAGAALIVVAAVIAGVAGFLLYESSSETGGASASAAHTTDASNQPAPAAAVTMTASEFVRREAHVLDRSAAARRLVVRAASESYTQGIADIRRAMATRRRLMYSVTSWDAPSSALHAQVLLTSALHASIVSDRYYLASMQEQSAGGSGNASRALGLQHDQEVTNPLKLHALRAYNRLRSFVGLAPISTSYPF